MGLLYPSRQVLTYKPQITYKTKILSGTSNGPTVLIYTVPANTKAKIFRATLTLEGPGGGGGYNDANLQIDGVSYIFFLYCAELSTAYDSFDVQPEQGIEVLPNQTVSVDANNGTATAIIYVLEETVQ